MITPLKKKQTTSLFLPPLHYPQQQLRANTSSTPLPGEFREVLQQRLGELERQLLSKVAELEDEKLLLHNETAAHRLKTENALGALLQRVLELERGQWFSVMLRGLQWPPVALSQQCGHTQTQGDRVATGALYFGTQLCFHFSGLCLMLSPCT